MTFDEEKRGWAFAGAEGLEPPITRIGRLPAGFGVNLEGSVEDVDDAGDRDARVGVAEQPGAIDPQGVGVGGDFDHEPDLSRDRVAVGVAQDRADDQG